MDTRIDVYIDMNNQNNVWGMIHSNDKKRPIKLKKDELVRFYDYQSMLYYVNNNYSKENITYHKIDYGCVEYYSHNGNPKLDYIAIKYYEYINGVRTPGKITMQPDLEQMFLEILRINKNIPSNMPLEERYHHDIDVYEENKIRRQEMKRNIKMSLDEFFAIVGNKIRNIKFNKKIVRGLVILIATVTLGEIIKEGYTLIEDDYHSEFIVQKHPVSGINKNNAYLNKGKVGIILEKLLRREYDEVNENDIKMVIDFLKEVEDYNYDNNDSYNSISFSDLNMNAEDYIGIGDVLKKVEELYNQSFTETNGKYALNANNAKKYLDYVLSLTFMYDDYHDTRSAIVGTNNTRFSSNYATSREIRAFDNFPPIMRFIILNQLKGMLSRCNYQVDVPPAYYSLSEKTDKYSLMNKLNEELEKVIDELYILSLKSNENKTI